MKDMLLQPAILSIIRVVLFSEVKDVELYFYVVTFITGYCTLDLLHYSYLVGISVVEKLKETMEGIEAFIISFKEKQREV